MRVLLYVSAALIVSLLGLISAPAEAKLDDEDKQELIKSFHTIESYLARHDRGRKKTRGWWNMKNYNDILEATRELIKNTEDRYERGKLARAESMLEKLEGASKLCTEESYKLFNDLGYVFYQREMRFLDEIIRKYRKHNNEKCR